MGATKPPNFNAEIIHMSTVYHRSIGAWRFENVCEIEKIKKTYDHYIESIKIDWKKYKRVVFHK